MINHSSKLEQHSHSIIKMITIHKFNQVGEYRKTDRHIKSLCPGSWDLISEKI